MDIIAQLYRNAVQNKFTIFDSQSKVQYFIFVQVVVLVLKLLPAKALCWLNINFINNFTRDEIEFARKLMSCVLTWHEWLDFMRQCHVSWLTWHALT